MHDRPSIGPRISIRGPTGSGKTTLGHTLGQRFGLPVVELDALYGLPNWQAKPLDQFHTDVKAALGACPQGWLCVGNYSHAQDLVLSQADTVLWWRLPFRVSFWRLCKRTVTRAWTKKPLWEGNPNQESWRQSFCSRNSILLYAITSRKMHVQNAIRAEEKRIGVVHAGVAFTPLHAMGSVLPCLWEFYIRSIVCTTAPSGVHSQEHPSGTRRWTDSALCVGWRGALAWLGGCTHASAGYPCP